jgi:uncharacterized protein YbcV (DUF1398 family)
MNNEDNTQESFDHKFTQKLEMQLFSGDITFEEFCEMIDQDEL